MPILFYEMTASKSRHGLNTDGTAHHTDELKNRISSNTNY